MATLLAAAAPAWTAGAASEAEPDRVTVRAAPHPGYGRLVFDWPGPIAFERTDGEGVVVVRFARPFTADLSAVPKRLGDYLRAIERTRDRRGVRLHPGADVRARLSHFEPDLVVVDLERPGAGDALDDPGVNVRTGEHDGFVRVVFEWPGPVGFRQQRDGRDLTLTFDREARVDAVALGRRLHPWLEELTAGSDAKGTRVRLRLEPGLDARAFIVEERRVVLDLLESARDDDEARATAQAGGDVSPRSPAAATSVPARKGEGAAAGASATTTAKPLEGVPSEAGPAAPGEPGPGPLAIHAAPRDEGIVLTFAWARPVPAAVFVRGGHLWTVFGAPVPAGAHLPPVLGAVADPYLGPAEALALEGGTALRFPLSRAAQVAVDRDGPLWQVTLRDRAAKPRPVPVERLDGPPRIRLGAAAGGGLLDLVDPVVGDRLTVWSLLEPGRGQPKERRLVDFELIESAQGMVWRPLSDRLEVELAEGAVELAASGGLLMSSPVPPAAEAATGEGGGEGEDVSSGADAKAHAAAHTVGAPVEQRAAQPAAPTTDGAAAHAQVPDDQPAPNRGPAGAKPSPGPVPGPPLGLADAAAASGGNAAARRGELIRAVDRAAPQDRGRARLDLARFYLARALAPETLAVLRHRGESDEVSSAALEAAREGIRGAAELLMGHLQEAEAALEAPALDDDREVALWRAVLAAARDDWPAAGRELGRSGKTLESYPRALQVRLGVPAALIAVETGDSSAALAILGRLADLGLHEAARARVAFVRGLAHARAGEVEQADHIWRRLAHGARDGTGIKATYARATMRLDAGLIDGPTARAELEASRPLWRGHPWELTMLDGLAQVRAQTGDPDGAIRVWQEALRRFPDAVRAQQMTDAMCATFKDAVLAGDEHALDPLRALALYRDFPDLMPPGEDADRLRRRLAERLAALDLIEPAAKLLGTLIEDHAGGIAKAEAGAHLAELWLRKPDAAAALEAIEASSVALELPEPIAHRRQLLRARALARLDRPQAALEALARRQDPPAKRLRLAVHWQEEAWPEVVRSIEALLAQRGEPDAAAWSADDRALVIRLAIAHGRSGDRAALPRLRERFGAAMRGAPGEAAFLLATMTPARGRSDTAGVLAAAEDHIGRLEDYLGHPTSEP